MSPVRVQSTNHRVLNLYGVSSLWKGYSPKHLLKFPLLLRGRTGKGKVWRCPQQAQKLTKFHVSWSQFNNSSTFLYPKKILPLPQCLGKTDTTEKIHTVYSVALHTLSKPFKLQLEKKILPLPGMLTYWNQLFFSDTHQPNLNSLLTGKSSSAPSTIPFSSSKTVCASYLCSEGLSSHPSQ